MSGKEIYVIYDTTNTIASAYVAKAVYIADPAGSGTGSGVPSATTGNVLREVKVYQGGVLIGTRTVLQADVPVGTYTTGQDYATVVAALPALNVVGATVVTDASTVVVVGGQTTTVTYVVALP